MGSCVCTGAGCCLSCCCQELLDGFHKLLGPEKMTKMCYILMIIIIIIPTIALLFFINKWKAFTNFFDKLSCSSNTTGQYFQCIGPNTVFRMSLSFGSLFSVLLIFMLFRTRLSMIINQGCFFIKYVYVLGIFVVFLFLNNQVFQKYSQISKYISIIFMVIQSIILIDLFYFVGIKLNMKYQEENKCYVLPYAILALILSGIAIAINIFGYLQFKTCSQTLWFNIATSIEIFLSYFFQFLRYNRQSNIITSSLVSIYISYLSLFAQYSYSTYNCATKSSITTIAIDITASSIFFILTLYGSVMGGASQLQLEKKQQKANQPLQVAPVQPQSDENLNAPKKYKIQDEKIKQEKKQQQNKKQQVNIEDQKSYTDSWIWVKWHIYMIVSSIYLGMLITNWTAANPVTGQIKTNNLGFWARFSISWATFIIYLWTLTAPKICKDRDFSVS